MPLCYIELYRTVIVVTDSKLMLFVGCNRRDESSLPGSLNLSEFIGDQVTHNKVQQVTYQLFIE